VICRASRAIIFGLLQHAGEVDAQPRVAWPKLDGFPVTRDRFGIPALEIAEVRKVFERMSVLAAELERPLVLSTCFSVGRRSASAIEEISQDVVDIAAVRCLLPQGAQACNRIRVSINIP
jgi:hypothetical protein